VASFLEGAVPFPAIAGSIDAALEAAARQGVQRPETLAAIRELDAWARTYTESRLQAASTN
jgi:1-deoxy-D-xylulose 5-phosphate reductoisomerase